MQICRVLLTVFRTLPSWDLYRPHQTPRRRLRSTLLLLHLMLFLLEPIPLQFQQLTPHSTIMNCEKKKKNFEKLVRTRLRSKLICFNPRIYFDNRLAWLLPGSSKQDSNTGVSAQCEYPLSRFNSRFSQSAVQRPNQQLPATGCQP